MVQHAAVIAWDGSGGGRARNGRKAQKAPGGEAEGIASVAARVALDAMRRRAHEEEPDDFVFKGGAATFFYKGTNGRWKDMLSPEELIEKPLESRTITAVVTLAMGADCPSFS